MSNIQKELEALQPYVISIRYLKGVPVVDIVLSEGWTIPDNKQIKVVKGPDESLNYFMLFSEEQGIGLDELLDYIHKIIKINLERERKLDLLKAKVNELKEVFKSNNLSKLQRLKFSFSEDEEYIPSINDLDIEPINDEIHPPQPVPIEENITEPIINPPVYLDEDGKPIEMTEEERELAEEEARAQRNIKITESRKKIQNPKPLVKKVELPPKPKLSMANEFNYESDCDCDDTQACDKCIDKKGY